MCIIAHCHKKSARKFLPLPKKRGLGLGAWEWMWKCVGAWENGVEDWGWLWCSLNGAWAGCWVGVWVWGVGQEKEVVGGGVSES